MWILQAKRGLAVYDESPGLSDYGQRVQNSVFECVVTEAQYSLLKGRVRDIIDMSLDSVRFLFLVKMRIRGWK